MDRFGPAASTPDDATLAVARAQLVETMATASTAPVVRRRLTHRRVLLVGGAVLGTTTLGVAAAASMIGLGYTSFGDTFSHWGSGSAEEGA